MNDNNDYSTIRIISTLLFRYDYDFIRTLYVCFLNDLKTLLQALKECASIYRANAGVGSLLFYCARVWIDFFSDFWNSFTVCLFFYLFIYF